MLRCSYCGSSIAVEERSGPDHLILPHKRSDKSAEEALKGYLLSRRRAAPSRPELDFSYVPFLVIDEKGETRIRPACGSPPLPESPVFPPAGNYRFFDEALASDENVIPAAGVEKGTTMILHLPVYRIGYKAGGWEGEAAVVGESWQVLFSELPPERRAVLRVQNVLAAAALFTIYLFLGKTASSLGGRFGILLAASLGGFLAFSLRRKLMNRPRGS